MSVNILDLFRNQIEGTLVNSASGFLGENESATKIALDAISTTLMGAIADKSSTETGASDILDMIMKDEAGASALNNINGLSPNEGHKLNDLMNKGLPIVRSLLGEKVGAVIDWITTNYGLKSGSVSSLMSLAAPFIIGLIGREVHSNNLNTAGLTNLLQAQMPYVRSLLPAGLAGIINFSAINNPRVAPPVFERNEPLISRTSAPHGVDSKNVDNSYLGRFIPWLILIVGLGLLWYFMRGCNNPKVQNTITETTIAIDTTKEDIADAVDTVKLNATNAYVALKGKVDEFGNWISDLGKEYEVKLPNGEVLKVYESSIERNLVDFINSGETDEAVLKNKWFSFDRLYFKSGKSELTLDSKTQLDNIAKILNAYSNVNIKMGGYTDSDGDESLNQKLSQERAETAKKELLKRGIVAARVESEGYGEMHPRCPANDTNECKSQNRRIDIRITKM